MVHGYQLRGVPDVSSGSAKSHLLQPGRTFAAITIRRYMLL